MISFFESSLTKLSVHHTGNKLMDEYYKLSDKPLDVSDEILGHILMHFFLKPFQKNNVVFRFYHPNDLALNDVFSVISDIFEGADFHQQSELLAKHLYEISNHPKIKSGEFYIAQFDKVQIEGEQLDAIGIFKSETKETYLSISPDQDGFKMSYKDDAISVNKLDKGCLIFKTEKAEGYKVVVFDNAKNSIATYWKDEFLQLEVRNDDYNQTTNFLNVYKQFVTAKLDDEFEISYDLKIHLLNKSAKYFKEREQLDLEEFGVEVLKSPAVIESFNNFKKTYEIEFESPIADTFSISASAVKKTTATFKKAIKLDKNFQIVIQGNSDLIEKGFDDDKAMNFYKLYFREEG